MGSDQPVYGLQAQGLYGRGGVKSNRLEAIAVDYINEIRSVQPNGPYYLSGLSNGGNIALEMAQQLQSQGEQVALLAMFDSYGPDGITLMPSLPRLLSSLNYVIRYSLPRFGARIAEKGVTEVLQSLRQKMLPASQQIAAPKNSSTNHAPTSHRARPRSIEDCMNNISQYILEHSPWSFFTPVTQLKNVEGSLSDTLKTLEEEYNKIHKAYKVRPYPGKITLFFAQECPPGYKRDPALGWDKIAISGVEIHPIPGHHTSIMQSKILTNSLKECIESASQQKNCNSEEL
jgi:thioesterase domain-containing protein